MSDFDYTPREEKLIKKSHFYMRWSFLVLGVAIAFVSIISFWRFENEEVFTPLGDHVVIVDEEARAGETVTVKLSYCKNIGGPVTFTRSFVNESTVISNPTLTDTTGKGCIKDRIVEVPVPPQMATGEYRIQYHTEAEINPIKTVSQEFYSENTVKVIGMVDQR